VAAAKDQIKACSIEPLPRFNTYVELNYFWLRGLFLSVIQYVCNENFMQGKQLTYALNPKLRPNAIGL